MTELIDQGSQPSVEEKVLWEVLDNVMQKHKDSVSSGTVTMNKADRILAKTIFSVLEIEKGDDSVTFDELIKYFNKKALLEVVQTYGKETAFKEFKKSLPVIKATKKDGPESAPSFPCLLLDDGKEIVLFSSMEWQSFCFKVINEKNRLYFSSSTTIEILESYGFKYQKEGLFVEVEGQRKVEYRTPNK